MRHTALTVSTIRLTEFWLFLTLLLLINVKAFGSPVSVNHHLITFAPDVRLKSSGGLCQGVRLADSYIATSKLCAEVIRAEMSHTVFEVIGPNNVPEGVIVEDDSGCAFDHCDMIFRIMADNAGHSASYPALHDDNDLKLPTYADFIATDGSLTRAVFSLEFHAEQADQSVYSVSASVALPPGTPVFDLKNNIVCLISTDDLCHSLPVVPWLRSRRDAGDDNGEGDDSENKSGGTSLYAVSGIIIFAVAVGINIACLGASYCRACSKGMPSSMFWRALLTFAYCTHPHTNYCLMFGWPGVLWSWIGAYDGSTGYGTDHESINSAYLSGSATPLISGADTLPTSGGIHMPKASAGYYPAGVSITNPGQPLPEFLGLQFKK